jgi:phospholipid/cholesterol/gamma-HCH transport system substrate-binding protein
MARTPNPALLGGFVLGAVVLAVAGLVVFGGGKFFRSTQPWVAYFDESIKGLATGAPVTFRGVKVGSVTNIKVVIDSKSEQVRVPVFLELEADRITSVEGGKLQFLPKEAGTRALIERGLRAQLETQSFVTGQLAINLDFHPGSPIRLVGGPEKYPEFPTIRSRMSALGRGLEELNTAELAKNVQDILQGMARLVNRPELEAAVVSGSAALKGLDRLVANADTRVTALGSVLDRTSASANDTLAAIEALARRVDGQTVTAVNETVRDAQRLVRRVDGETVPAVSQVLTDLRPLVDDAGQAASAARELVRRVDAETVPAVNRLLAELRPLVEEVGKTAGATRELVRRVDTETVPAVSQLLADLGPLVQEIERTAGAARGALEKAETTLASVDGVLEEQSPLRYQLRVTLQELAAAARAFRTLSSYLERRPESVLFGKGRRGVE